MGFSVKTKSRSWMVTIQEQNMIKAGLTEEQYRNPEVVAGFFQDLWESSGKDRKAGIVVCMSQQGLYHCHMACYGNTTTLKKVAEILFDSHVEPQLGGKEQLKAYLLKEGEFAEKGESILYATGLDVIQDKQGKRSDIEAIEELLSKGMTPQEILSTNFSFYKYEKMILHAYIDQRIREAPVKQSVYCEWHVGNSGTGKTYYYNQLCEERGADKIYVLTDYDNNASGGLDAYMKEGAVPILFMDEFKGFGISYQKLLTMLNGYSRMQTHSRYANTYNLWDTVIITSVYPPEAVYQNMVSREYHDIDSLEQLMRRISKIVYHYIENGEYKTYSIDSKDYTTYKDLIRRVSRNSANDGFRPITNIEQMELPFTEE
jgi:hypothetical protein